MITTNHNVV